MSGDSQPFWTHKRLADLDPEEWESLCDGCARCCLVKLEDADTGEIHYTGVTCKLLDIRSCRCKGYATRKQVVPACFTLAADTIQDFPYLPSTCAYRRLFEGKDLPEWHPLVTGNKESVHSAGVSVRGKAVSEECVHPDDLEMRIILFPE